jgi:hypothetical protein
MAYEASGWNEIRGDLIDGNGAEFIVPISGLSAYEFTATTELEAVQLAAD